MNALNSLEYQLKPDDQLCYIHIPKTAGSTLTAIADANFDVRTIAPAPRHLADVNPAAKTANTPEAIADLLTHYRLIRGHFSYNEIRKVLRQPVYMTVLRDPVDRVISVYEFFRRAGDRGEAETHEYERLMAAASHDLLHFVQHLDPIVRLRTCNYQIHQVAGWQGDPSAFFELSEAEQWDAAQRSLETFAWVGLTERFQDSVFLLSYLFGWYPALEYQSLRVVTKKSRRAGISEDVIAAIAAQNQLDIALYQAAKQRFERQFAQMLLALDQFPLDPLNPDQLKTSLERHYEQRFVAAHPTPCTALDFDFRQAAFGMGWHRRNGGFNGIKATGGWFRWTGPGTISTLDFPLATKTDLTVRLQISNAIAVDLLDSLTLTVNAQPIKLLPVKSTPNNQTTSGSTAGRSRLLHGIIPRAALVSAKGFVRFTFGVNRTAPISSIAPNQADTRLVGVAIRRLELVPRASWWNWVNDSGSSGAIAKIAQPQVKLAIADSRLPPTV